MQYQIKIVFLFLFFILSGCDYSPENKTVSLSDDIYWMRNSDGVFYGKTCIDNKLFVVSLGSHSNTTLSGIIGSCNGTETFKTSYVPDVKENFKWITLNSGISYFYTCIEEHLFTVSLNAYRTQILSLVGNDCSVITK